jgi:hypothetical protein
MPVTVVCDQCSKPFLVSPSRVGIRRCCSRRCLAIWRSEEAKRVFAEQNSTLEQTRRRFIACVDVRGQDECWPWKLALTDRGYGQFQLPGYKDQRKASHAAYVLFVGPVLPDHDVHHACENKACVNWRHLESVPHAGPDGHGARHRKAACGRGHPLSGENVYVRPDGRGRQCKICNRLRSRRDFHSEQATS